MIRHETYSVGYFLLDEKWKELGVECGRISCVVSNTGTLEEHEKWVEEEKRRLLSENEDDYTSWVFTNKNYEDMGGALGHVTVLHFRVRDIY